MTSFGNPEWIYDSTVLEVYQSLVNVVLPNYNCLEMHSVLSVKVIEELKNYLVTGATPKYM